ncbi:hypothetical protein T265_07806 [Opisthorchis viverrini]|uniref:Uncharacterized protein n=1 Tax=Opisthorchis viverrini TaxID=6198 RepID=A0A074ZB63_OPIVI|nr:hypothetical protein T265_07806 [Opisthorchis viverrini]KER24536.1 hypothetical protein T265_07806 [Opisthorchis viverrini]
MENSDYTEVPLLLKVFLGCCFAKKMLFLLYPTASAALPLEEAPAPTSTFDIDTNWLIVGMQTDRHQEGYHRRRQYHLGWWRNICDLYNFTLLDVEKQLIYAEKGVTKTYSHV